MPHTANVIASSPVVLAVALACTACAPIPHAATTMPAISGSLTSGGVPVVGRDVWAAQGTDEFPCGQPRVKATTDQNGRFTLPRQTEWRLIYAPSFASSKVIKLCASTAGQPRLIFRLGFIPTTPQAIELACDLETPASRQTHGGLCRMDATTGS